MATDGEFNELLSAEELAFCCHKCGFGCHGGDPIKAWERFRKHGLVTGGNYGSYEVSVCESANAVCALCREDGRRLLQQYVLTRLFYTSLRDASRTGCRPARKTNTATIRAKANRWKKITGVQECVTEIRNSTSIKTTNTVRLLCFERRVCDGRARSPLSYVGLVFEI